MLKHLLYIISFRNKQLDEKLIILYLKPRNSLKKGISSGPGKTTKKPLILKIRGFFYSCDLDGT
jgi:hypothetical protein